MKARAFNTMKCPICGKEYKNTVFKFCPKDGTELVEVKKTKPDEELIVGWCAKCNVPINVRKLEKGHEACPICGGKLKIIYPMLPKAPLPGGQHDTADLISEAIVEVSVPLIKHYTAKFLRYIY